MPNAISLTVREVDRGGLGGALVGAHREHALTERRPAQVPDEQAQRDRRDQRDPAEHRARLVAVESAEGRPWTEVEPGQAEVGHRRAVRPDAPGACWRSRSCAIATAPARVTTVRLTPRTRSAETAVISPITTATATPASAAHGKPMPASTAKCEIVKPAAPARASWATETWPTKPVMTTSDRPSARRSATRRAPGGSRTAGRSARRRRRRRAAGPPRATARGRGAAGSRCSTSSPREGSSCAAQEQRHDDDHERRAVPGRRGSGCRRSSGTRAARRRS